MVIGFNWCGWQAAQERKEKVLEVCNRKGWRLLCMQPGKRYCIQVGAFLFYWTFDEVFANADIKSIEGKKNKMLLGDGNG